MNKKGQLDFPIIGFIVLVIGIFIIGPVLLKVFSSIQGPMSNALGNVTGGGGAVAQKNFDTVMVTSNNMMDNVLVFVFVIAVIMLIVSAFLIDTSPFWIILYIFISMMLVILTPNIIEGLDNIWTKAQFAQEVADLSFLNFIRMNFMFILVSIILITGVIIYGKISKGFGSANRL